MDTPYNSPMRPVPQEIQAAARVTMSKAATQSATSDATESLCIHCGNVIRSGDATAKTAFGLGYHHVACARRPR